MLCPPFTNLLAVAALLEGTDIGLGAQNMHWEMSGAFTGEISPAMVSELCHYVIIGHSERRTYFGETDETVNRKVQAALAHGLTPIVCVGETLAEYEAGQTAAVVSRQVRQGLAGIGGLFEPGSAAAFVIAYEPVWAIGTGKPSTAAGSSCGDPRYDPPGIGRSFRRSRSPGCARLVRWFGKRKECRRVLQPRAKSTARWSEAPA